MVKSKTVIKEADKGKGGYSSANLALSLLFSNATLMLNQDYVYIYTLLNYSVKESKNLLNQ